MKKLLLLLPVLLFSLGQAQDFNEGNIPVDVKMSEVFEDGAFFKNMAFSANDGNENSIIGRGYLKGYIIEHYDKNMKLVKNLNFELDRKNGKIECAFINKNKLYLIEYLFNKKKKSLECYANISPIETLTFEKKLLFSTSTKFVRKNVFLSGQIPTTVFTKGQKFIAFDINHIKELNGETHDFYVFNQNLEKVYETTFKREGLNRLFRFQNIAIDENDGTIYLLGKKKLENTFNKKQGVNYNFELYKINEKTRSSLIFDPKDKHIGALKIISENNKLSCVGFYSEKEDYQAKGLIYLDVGFNEKKLNNITYSPFTAQFLKDKYGNNTPKELKNLEILDVYLNKKGEYIITAEEFKYLHSGNTIIFPYSNSYTSAFFKDILCAKINNDGKLIWARSINKHQNSNALPYSNTSSIIMPSNLSPSISEKLHFIKEGYPHLSFTSNYFNNKLFLFVNCSDKVTKLEGGRLSFCNDFSKNISTFYIMSIDENGHLKYKKLSYNSPLKVPFTAGKGMVGNSGGDLIFEGGKGKKKQLMKLSLE